VWAHVCVFNTCGEHCYVECSVTCFFVPTEPPIEFFTSTKLLCFILFNYRVFYTINKPQCIYAFTSWWLSRSIQYFQHSFTIIWQQTPWAIPPSPQVHVFSMKDTKRGHCWIRGYAHFKRYRHAPLLSKHTFPPSWFPLRLSGCTTVGLSIHLLEDIPLFPVFIFFFFSYPFLLCSFSQYSDFCKGLGSMTPPSRKQKMQFWAPVGRSQLLLARESWLRGCLPPFMSSDIKSVAWWWEYFHHGNQQIWIIREHCRGRGVCTVKGRLTLGTVVKYIYQQAPGFQEQSLPWQNQRESPQPFKRS